MKKRISLILVLCIFASLLSGCKIGDHTLPNAITRTQDMLGYTSTSTITITSDFDFSNIPGLDEGSLNFIHNITKNPMHVTTRKQTNEEYTKGIIEITIAADAVVSPPQSATFWIDYDFTSANEDELKMSVILAVPYFLTEQRELLNKQIQYFLFDFTKVPKLKAMLPAIKTLNQRRKILHNLTPIDGFLAELSWTDVGNRTFAKLFDDKELKTAIWQMANLELSEDEIYRFLVFAGAERPPSVQEAPGSFVEWTKPAFALPMLLDDGLLLEYTLSKGSFFSPRNQHIEAQNISFSFPIIQQTADILQTVPSVKVDISTTLTDDSVPEITLPNITQLNLDVRNQVLTALDEIHLAIYKNAITPEPITIYVDGERIVFTAKNRPQIFNESTMVPAQFFFKELGGVVSTVEKDGVSILTVKRPGVDITVTPDSLTATINGEIVELTAPTLIHDERLYVPIRFAADAMNLGIRSDITSGRTIITLTSQ